MSEIEDGMGFSGLAPTAAERAEETYYKTRDKIAATREQQLRDTLGALVTARSALRLIAGMKGKTLLGGMSVLDLDADRAYQLGANRAFEQAADVAINALSGEQP